MLNLLAHWRSTGVLHVVYALAVEGLGIGYLYLIGFFTIETLLPTFVTVRFSLASFLLFLIVATILLALLGRFLDVSFGWNFTRNSPLLWLGSLWGIGILAVSLIKFPPMILLILIALFIAAGFLFWHVFFEEK
jgi:hypothetical protein